MRPENKILSAFLFLIGFIIFFPPGVYGDIRTDVYVRLNIIGVGSSRIERYVKRELRKLEDVLILNDEEIHYDFEIFIQADEQSIIAMLVTNTELILKTRTMTRPDLTREEKQLIWDFLSENYQYLNWVSFLNLYYFRSNDELKDIIGKLVVKFDAEFFELYK